MPAREFPGPSIWFAALSLLVLLPPPAWAYVGPGPGLEFVPHFLSLLAWLGLAFGGALTWPITAAIQRWRQRSATPHKS